ncbi:hypothetical protein [Comamonas sp.]|nr:hypothetical protein [Comamonas sp.]
MPPTASIAPQALDTGPAQPLPLPRPTRGKRAETPATQRWQRASARA